MADLVDVRLLQAFLAVAKELNITRAAARTHMTQQTLSVQIQRLERAMGVDLLVRSTRGVRLTPAGEALAQAAADVVAELDGLAGRVRAAAGRAVGVA